MRCQWYSDTGPSLDKLKVQRLVKIVHQSIQEICVVDNEDAIDGTVQFRRIE